MHGDDEVESGEDRRESRDEDAYRGRDHPAVGVSGGVRRIEGPAGIHASGDHGEQRKCTARDQQIPAQQVDFGERQVARADHNRQEEIAQHRGNRRDHEEKDHRHGVHGEELVVGFRAHQVALGREQLHADQRGEGASDEEEHADREQVQNGDALMVLGEEPRCQAMTRVEVMLSLLDCGGNHMI